MRHSAFVPPLPDSCRVNVTDGGCRAEPTRAQVKRSARRLVHPTKSPAVAVDGQLRVHDAGMNALGRLMPALALTVCLTACTMGEASNEGTALLRNETEREDLRVTVLDDAGRPVRDAALDPAFRFDTQFTDRERQCLVAGDGSFELRDAQGVLLVAHDFADRPVCEYDVLIFTDHPELVWDD